MAVHKKTANTETQKVTEVRNDKKIDQEPVVVSDVVTETIEVIEETDPLSDFKEKMIKEEEPFADESQKKNYMWPILFIFIIIIALLVGIFLYKKGMFKVEKTNVVSVSPTPIITPEPTKTAVDLTKFEIEILNGSEVNGEASRQKASLEAEGFTISSVGNAGNSDYKETIIKAKAEVDKDFIAKLKTVLENSFAVKEEVLPNTASVPVEVIIGTKK